MIFFNDFSYNLDKIVQLCQNSGIVKSVHGNKYNKYDNNIHGMGRGEFWLD